MSQVAHLVTAWWLGGRRQPPGAPRLRWGVVGACLAVATLASLAATVTAAAGDRAAVLRLAAVGLMLLVATLLRWAWLLTAGLLALGAAAAVSAVGSPHGSALVLMAGLLVLTGELAGWAHDLRSIVPPPPVEVRRRGTAVAAATLVGTVAAAAIAAVSGLGAPAGVLPVVLGGAATVVLLSLVAFRRWRGEGPRGSETARR